MVGFGFSWLDVATLLSSLPRAENLPCRGGAGVAGASLIGGICRIGGSMVNEAFVGSYDSFVDFGRLDSFVDPAVSDVKL